MGSLLTEKEKELFNKQIQDKDSITEIEQIQIDLILLRLRIDAEKQPFVMEIERLNNALIENTLRLNELEKKNK